MPQLTEILSLTEMSVHTLLFSATAREEVDKNSINSNDCLISPRSSALIVRAYDWGMEDIMTFLPILVLSP